MLKMACLMLSIAVNALPAADLTSTEIELTPTGRGTTFSTMPRAARTARTSACTDDHQWGYACPTWSSLGFCSWHSWVRSMCKQTCGLCSNASPLNNVDYVLAGYDALRGNPTGNRVDPGFKSGTPIFVGSYNQQLPTLDGKYLVPDGFSARVEHSCSTEFRSEVDDSVEEYENELNTVFGASGGYAG